MTSFAPAAAQPAVASPDPSKHVNYTLGMVLGVEDFTQEFAYLSGRDRWLARDAIGYGTVAGLPVRVQRDGAEARVHVGAGTALSPCGQLICVDAEQCASIDAWLLEHADELRDHPARTPLPVYVTLCYRAALADDVPIPGEPCRSEDELMEPSRVQDCFRLELRLDPPPQCEEDAVGGFVAWLRAVELTDDARAALRLDAFLDALREASGANVRVDPRDVRDGACPPGFAPGRPARPVAIPRAEACDYVRAASRVWATELRPRLRWPAHAVEDDCGCGCGGVCEGPCRDAGMPGGCADDACEDAVLLAELRLPVAAPPGEPLRLDGTAWELDERRRPYLLHLRALQELLACGVLAEGGGGSGAPGRDGRDGRDGADGRPGRDGRDGAEGRPGRDGADGRPGRDGRDGANGRDGRDGRNGANGHDGSPGDPGPPGPSTLVAGGEFLFRDVSVGDKIETVFSFPRDDLVAILLAPGYYRLEWGDFDRGRDYLVVGTPLVQPYDVPHTFEVIRFDKPDEAPEEFQKGIVVRLLSVQPSQKPPKLPGLDNPGKFDQRDARGFMVEISDVTELVR